MTGLRVRVRPRHSLKVSTGSFCGVANAMWASREANTPASLRASVSVPVFFHDSACRAEIREACQRGG